MQIDHYRLDVDDDKGGFSFTYVRRDLRYAVSQFEKHRCRAGVSCVTLRGVSAWGDHIENVKHYSANS
jgi:hypothetical protein